MNHITKSIKTFVTDYLILGGGSAGCVLANRLSENNLHQVTLLEAGKDDKHNWDWWKINMPAALTYNLESTKYNWGYTTSKQKGLNGRSIDAPRGKVLGGCSSINAMVYIRGHKLDFDRWGYYEGATGWTYDECLPYFIKSQKHADISENIDSKGFDGPLDVKTISKGDYQELFNVFIKAGIEAGYPYINNINNGIQEGFGPLDMTISPNGIRCSTANAFIRPIINKRNNLRIKCNSHVNRIIFDTKSGDCGKPKAIGVEYFNNKTKNTEIIYAKKEIISSLGAIGSPTLLQRSGIGDAQFLQSIGCENIIYNNPYVGKNLQDHTEVYLQYKCNKPITLYPISKWNYKRIKAGMEWFLNGKGICSSNLFHAGAFIKSRDNIQHPDIQYHFIPGAVIGQSEFLPIHAFQIHVGTLRPKSKGVVNIKSLDPSIDPIIDPKYYSESTDLEDMKIALKHAVDIVSQPAFKEYKSEIISPMDVDILENEKLIENFIRENTHSAYHLSCTCKMGDDQNGENVVNSKGQVYGVDNLRIVDSSIFPSMTSGNLNAPTIMLAEKISDEIKKEIKI